MPTSPPSLCPRCRRPTRGRCTTCRPAHRRTTDQQRGNSNSRGYNSHWRRVIRPAFLRANPLCALCGQLATVPDHWPETRASLVARGVTDPDASHRLRALCETCHNLYGLSYKPWVRIAPKYNELVTLVAGPPCAGKNTYIEQREQPGDTLVDYDIVMQNMTGQPTHDHDQAMRDTVRRATEQAAARLLASGDRGWIIATAPKASDRHKYAELGVHVVLLLPPIDVALERARRERPPSWTSYVHSWYRRYEPDPRDDVITT